MFRGIPVVEEQPTPAGSPMFKGIPVEAPVEQPAAPPTGYGNRPDGTPKGKGYFGELKRPDGGVSTELSIGVEFDGKETEIPAIVPSLTKQELDHLLSGGRPTDSIVEKAKTHAVERMSKGMSPFASDGEQSAPPASPSIPRAQLSNRTLWDEARSYGRDIRNRIAALPSRAAQTFAPDVRPPSDTEAPKSGLAPAWRRGLGEVKTDMDLAAAIDWQHPESWESAKAKHAAENAQWEKQAPRSKGLLRRTFEDVAGTLGPMAVSYVMDIPTGEAPGLSLVYWEQQGRGEMLGRALTGIDTTMLNDDQRRSIDYGATVAGTVYSGIEQANRFRGGKDVRKALKSFEDFINKSPARKYIHGVVGESAEEGLQQAVGDIYVNYVRAISNPTMPPEERQAALSAWDIIKSGGQAFLQSIPTMAILGAGNVALDAAQKKLSAPAAGAITPEDLADWALKNPDKAKTLAGIESPSRKDFDAAGLPRSPAAERARVSGALRSFLAPETAPAPAGAPAAAPATETPAPAPTPATPAVEPPAPPAETPTPTATPAPAESVVAGQAINTAPTEAQKEAGNYQKGHIEVDGYDITVENPVGSVRSGTDGSGKKWSQKMAADYGYIKGTVGYDKDHLDVFVKPDYDGESETVHVIDQVNPQTGKFDEHKVIFGADDANDAMDVYESNYAPGWKGAAGITEMSYDDFKSWAYDQGKTGPKGGALSKPVEKIGVKGVTKEPEQTVAPAPAPAPEPMPLPATKDFGARARAIIESEDDAGTKQRSIAELAKSEGVDEKTAQERVESVLVDVGREIASHPKMPARQKFDELVKLYNKQPRFSKRSSTSVRDQAYSTPLPLAFAGAMMADVTNETGVYDATGGHGALTITADKANVSINEINPGRLASLRRQGYDDITDHDATKWSPAPKSVDRVMVNPPFGTLDEEQLIDGYRIRKLEHLIAIKALTAMRDDGRATVIVGGSMMEKDTGATDRIFINYLMNKYHVVGNFEVSGDLYEKQGAGFPVRVIVIDGRKSASSKMEDLAPDRVPRLDEWDEVYDAIGEVRHESAKRRAAVVPEGKPGTPDADSQGGSGPKDSGRDDSSSSDDGESSGSGGKRTPRRPGVGDGRAGRPGRETSGGGGKAGPERPGDADRGGGDGSVDGSGERGDANPDGAGGDTGADGSGGGSGPDGVDGPGPDVKKTDFADLTDDEIDALVKAQSGKVEPPKTDAPKQDPAPAPAPSGKIGRKGVTKSAKPSTTKSTGKRSGGAIIKSAGKNTVNAMDQAAQGLREIFGGGARLGMGVPIDFDPETYARAKPHFEAAWRSTKAAGKDFGDFVRWVMDLGLPGNVGLYLKRFRDDLAAAKKALEDRRRAESHDWGRVNDRQNRYGGESKSPKIGTIINRFLSDSTRGALEALRTEVGDVDVWLAGKLGYADIDAMHAGLAGEQVDGAALAIWQIEHDGAIIIGDQTGIGKGRQAAAIMRYAMTNGWTPVFLTADPKLFSDMHGDLLDIGTTVKPFIMGDSTKSSVRDERDNVAISAGSSAKQKTIMRQVIGGEKTLDEIGHNAVFLPYSQLKDLTKQGEPSTQHQFIGHLAANANVLFVMDESHKATGEDSITGLFLRGGELQKKIGGVRRKIQFGGAMRGGGVKGIAYLSATYAKRPDSMPLYFATSLGKAVKNIEKLPAVFAKGGIAMQQAVAEALAKAGQYIRRESDFSGVAFRSKSAAQGDEAKARIVKSVDQVAGVLREIVQYSTEVKKAIASNGRNIVSTSNTESGLASSDFASSLHNYISQMLLAAKADATADEAIAAWKRGEKPVIALSNTMGKFIEGYVADNGTKPGDEIGITFADILQRALDRTMTVSEKDPGGVTTKHVMTASQLGLQDEYDVIVELINELDNSLPASPIDHMAKRMRDAGMVVDEITGRDAYIEYDGKGNAIYRMRTAKEINDKNAHVNRFNREETDALIINQSGSTGISLHASRKNAAYKPKPRHMIVAQADLNIDTFTQTLGRILRTGLVGPAKEYAQYTLLSLPLEVERRPNAVLSMKMTSLNANTTADAESDVKVDALDFLNKYGDLIAAQILHEDSDLALSTGIDVELDEEGQPEATPGLAKKLTGRMAVLDNARQADVYQMLEERYTAMIQELKESGAYDIEIDVQHGWAAELNESEELDPGTDQSSMFTAAVKLEEYSIVDPRKPPTPDDLRAEFKDKLGAEDLEAVASVLSDRLAKIRADMAPQYEAYIKEPAEDASKIIRSAWELRRRLAEENRITLEAKLDEIARLFGKRVSVVLPGAEHDQLSGFITDIRHSKTSASGNPMRGSLFIVDMMIESRRRRLHIPVSNFTGNKHGSIWEDYRESGAIEDFAKSIDRGERVTKHIMTGNLVKAMEIANGGQITSFAKKDGSVVTGLVLPENFSMGDVEGDKDPRNHLDDGKAVVKFLDGGYAGDRRVEVEGGVMSISKGWVRGMSVYRISTPRAKSKGSLYTDTDITRITGDFLSSGRFMVANTGDPKVIERLAKVLIEKKKLVLSASGGTHAQVAEANGRDPADKTDNYPAGFSGRTRTQANPTAGATADPTQGHDIVAAIKRMWPDLAFRGAGTFRKRARGWYSRVLGEMRTNDARDIDAALHELGHHFDRELGQWSTSTGLPAGIPTELVNLGRAAYGSRKPANGYRSEGFAEFIREYLTGGNIQAQAPKVYKWFTTEYLVSKPAEARKLRELERIITAYRTQTPEQFVRAFRQPLKQDWSAERVAAAVASLEATQRDENLPVLRAMQRTGADLSRIKPEDHPYMLLTAYSRSAGGAALHSAIGYTSDLSGEKNGDSLRDALAPVSEKGSEAVEQWKDYAISRRALDLHDRGVDPGITREDALAVVGKYDSPEFRAVTDAVTAWSRRQLHLLVEAGAMTSKEFADIEALNPVYVPFSRQFSDGELKEGKNGLRGRGVYRIKGSGREINDPLDALVLQSERITQTAMQADVLRSLVKFYDSQKSSAAAMGTMMSEVPAPQRATTFGMEKIKKDVLAKAATLGADPAAITAALVDTWNEQLTVFTKSDEYRGKDNIVSVVVDGKRRWFEIDRTLVGVFEGMAREGALPGKIGEFSRWLVGVQRLGATGLNPAFGLLRNPLRDTLTASITADYHFHVPVLSTLAGAVMDIMNTEMAQKYHAAGIDISGRMGQDMKQAKKAGRRVTAASPLQKIGSMGWISGIREVLSHSEVGPRLMEFRGAYTYGMNKWGSAKSASILARCAAKDSTVNFSRAGSTGRAVNEVVLFYNAAVQSVDKFARMLGVLEAAPWARSDSRSKTALRSFARGALFLTAATVMNYLRNRDDEWWKELPAYEKWGYIHIKGPSDAKAIARIPLPFEAGAVFGALPVAVIEGSRTPGALAEALSTMLKANSPIELGSWAAVLRNVSGLAPVADIIANEDWKGSDIVPVNIERSRMRADQYTTGTSELAKMIGAAVPFGYSPAKIDHLLSGYTGGLYKRAAAAVAMATDSSAIGAGGDMSTLPILGTLFLRPGTSRVTGEFYDRLDELRRRKGSKAASLAEIGELSSAERTNRDLQDKWADRRKAIGSGRPAADVKAEADALMLDVQKVIREHQRQPQEALRLAGIGSAVYAATSPGAEPQDKAEALRLLAGVSMQDVRKGLAEAVKARDGHTNTDAYRHRLYRLSKLGLE